MKALFKKYLWLFEFIGAAIILGVGLVCKFVPAVLYFIVGIIFVFLGLFRIIPLVKTTEDKLLKWFYAGEMIIEVAAGVVLTLRTGAIWVFLPFTAFLWLLSFPTDILPADL